MKNTEIRKEIKMAIENEIKEENYKLGALKIDYKNKTFKYDLKEEGNVFTTEKGHFTVVYKGCTNEIIRIKAIYC